jgi:hypothetical protein
MTRISWLVAVVGLIGGAVAPAPAAAQPGCEPIIAAMNAEMKAPAWHRTVDMKTARVAMKMEIIKADGQLFSRRNDGPWTKMPMDAADLNQTNGELLKSGKLTLSDCKRVGAEAVDAVATTIYEYTSTMAGMPKPYSARLWIGVADSLPYKGESATMTHRTEYRGVKAPQ